MADKLAIARLRSHVLKGALGEIWTRPETSSLEALQSFGFSQRMIDSFFRPFFGGIFLETELATSSRMLEFVFRMFSEGRAALPAGGIGAISEQLAGRLPRRRIRTGSAGGADRRGEGRAHARRAGAGGGRGHRDRGARGGPAPPRAPPAGVPQHRLPLLRGPRAPISKPILVLNGEGSGPVDNLCVPSAVSPSYAPAGQALISATVVGAAGAEEKNLEAEVRRHLASWFGIEVADWRHLRTYRIPLALPARKSLEPAALPVRRKPGLYLCGDHRETPSLQGAMVSGRRAAEAVIEDWGEDQRRYESLRSHGE